jgi:hypothetical protein
MKRIQVSKNFFLDEFIDPQTYAARGARSIELIDMRCVDGIQFARDHVGPLFCNTWATGGSRRLSGLRPHNTTVGAKWSQHKYGNGFDVISKLISPAELHAFILEHEDLYIGKGWVTTLEDLRDTPTWTHMDNRYTGMDKIRIVRA